MMHAQTVTVPDGYATQNGGTTGGGSATPDTVTTASEFKSAAWNNDPAVIIVQGRLNIGDFRIGICAQGIQPKLISRNIYSKSKR